MKENTIVMGLEIGSWADWIGIVVTIITIVLTVRYYSKDNRRKLLIGFDIVPITHKEDNSVTYVKSSEKYIIWAVNVSKVNDSVSYSSIRYKPSFYKRIKESFFSAPKSGYMSQSLEEFIKIGEPTKFEILGEREKTSGYEVRAQSIDNFALERFRKNGKKVVLWITFTDILGKEYKRELIYTKEELKKMNEG
ncbi:hypothetical protein [Vagococcus carniphilus]|uniref:hypothetical protein n=1 Tax=Vagococcus carniphilus TaxID=218144 RepID=UPI00289231E3|nr:hypothetical protein [Vagococcus carniphilus]MDT2864345.1 hypothetical protein [Vagococcus carniphilus]